jgi:hypothetical protein
MPPSATNTPSGDGGGMVLHVLNTAAERNMGASHRAHLLTATGAVW